MSEPADQTQAGMRRLAGGVFEMGSERFYPEEAPRRQVRIDPFWIDETPVSNDDFQRFVDATGHVTLAEIAPDPADYPGMPPELAVAGSLVFEKPEGPLPRGELTPWWQFQFGADWRHPRGPGSSLDGLGAHPVVHIAYEDAAAYAAWAGKALPTEAEWEYAARGGDADRDYAWGDELAPGGQIMANYWLGDFPYSSEQPDQLVGPSAVRNYPPNDYGLFDMIGNVWEWTTDWYAERGAAAAAPKSCCIPHNPKGPASVQVSYDPYTPELAIGRKVLKGGSFLCAPNYCQRYRPAARQPGAVDSSSSHIGFRCVRREAPPV
ncbi:formylglycine-generating enzyme family protein [Rugamonas sp.]|uniref:formylglycine-generating enzyme family protein n=1 Tax=Rugamonas sp. TaxID=1926287 RepID=UPI0025E229C9|nr:formylglycine-generating enzyme family protein [Rugamonas sp.]